MLKPAEMAKLAATAMDEKMAKEITVMRTTDVTVLADYFILCTASSTTHVKTILIDFGCVVVHVFMEEAREFYDLERLWADAEKIDMAQLG